MNRTKIIEGENFTGFVHYFTQMSGSENIQKYISVEAPRDPKWSDASVLLDHSIQCSVSTCNYVTPGNESDSYVQFNFLFSPIYLTAYTLRTRTDDASAAFPRSWRVDGSYDNESWFEIDEVTNTSSLSYVSAVHTFQCQKPAIINHMKITLTEPNWGQNQEFYRFHLSRVDFFGEMYGFNTKTTQTKTCFSYFSISHSFLFLIML